jgi:putative spermidine/putrescine transport system permease protein
MVAAIATDIFRTPDGVPLKLRLRQVERARKLKAVMLVAPLLLYIVISFLIPIGVMLKNGVWDPKFAEHMPATVASLANWDQQTLPDEAAFAAVVADLKQAQRAKATAFIGKRLNYDISGIRSKIIASGRKAEKLEAGPYKDTLIQIDPIWGQIETWLAIERAGHRLTPFYLLSALDLEYNIAGEIVGVPKERAVYRDMYVRTFWIGLQVTVYTLLLGFPVAYLLATLPTRTANLLMILVLLPFWTSLLVRTTAWFVLLQDSGPINDVVLLLAQNPLKLIFSRTGTLVAMIHIQLPFTLLPIYSVMKTISPNYVRAARSLGAGPFYAFWRVYFPQTMPGIAAGCLLTFILCLGYYITPALVGGPSDQMVSNYIALAINQEGNWGKASALGTILLLVMLILYFIYNRLIGIDKLRLG